MGRYEIVAVAILSAPAAILSTAIFDDIYLSLIIGITIPGYSASGTALVQFNGDTSANYSYSISDNMAAVTQNNSQSGLPVSQTANTPVGQLTMAVGNAGTATKPCNWHATGGVLASANCSLILGSGVWGNSTDSINQIQLNSGGVNMNAGTRIAVIGIEP